MMDAKLSERMRHFDAKWDNRDPGWFADEVAALESRVAELEEAGREFTPKNARALAEWAEEFVAESAVRDTLLSYADKMEAALRSADPTKAGEQADIQKAE
jgi:hypothetical protein